MESTILSLLPLFIMQSIYAVLVAQIARRRNKSVLIYVLASLIPVAGTFFFMYVMWSTILNVLDSINEIKARQGTSSLQ